MKYRCPSCKVIADRTCLGDQCTCECGHTQTVHTQGSRGLGDDVANLLSKLGFKKSAGCGCSKRQQKLNQWFPRRR